MNSFINKKVIVIYRVNSFILLFWLSFFSRVEAQDLNSYCFERTVSLQEVHRVLNPFLMAKDIISDRSDDNCIDIANSASRANLFEKLLSKKFTLIKESVAASKNLIPSDVNCLLELKSTQREKKESSQFKIGEKNVLNTSSSNSVNVTSMEILLGSGLSGELEIGIVKLNVTCQLLGSDSANLIFSYVEKEKANVTSKVLAKKGEWLNIASVINDLSAKIKAIGIPQTEVSQSSEVNESLYELKLK